MPLLRLNRAIAVIGFTVKRNTWNTTDSRLYQFNRKFVDNFFEGVPSPAGGILVLTPLIFSMSSIELFKIDYAIIVPIFFVVTSILLISKFPT